MGLEIFEPQITKENDDRKLATFFLASYNQEKFISAALEGAFSQTYQPLEIVLSDDCSTDQTFEIMQQMVREYRGPHKIILNQTEHNLGLCGNVNHILDLASGEIIVLAAGDDISLPSRVEKSVCILSENKDVNCVSFQLQIIDRNGARVDESITSVGALKKYTLQSIINQCEATDYGASRAFRKSVYEYFGPLAETAATEDSTTLLRCLMLGDACCSDDVGVYFRIHGENYNAGDGKHSINYKKIYWQYLKDISVAAKRGALLPKDEKFLKKALRRRLRQNITRTGYFKSHNKLKYFFTNIAFSNDFGFSKKASYFYRAGRDVFLKRRGGPGKRSQ